MGYYVKAESDVYIYVEDINPSGGKTLLFLHGWPADHKLFEYQYSLLPQMGYRCIGIDLRGFGQSSKPWGGYNYNRMSDDVRAVIDALELDQIMLCGHSTGGAIAVRYMARHEGYGVARLGLFAAAAPSLIQRPYFPYGLPAQAVLEIIQDTSQNRPEMLRKFGNMIFHNFVTPNISQWILSMGMEAANWATSAVANTWLGEEQLFEDLDKIQVPTLILHGYDDKVCLFPLAQAQAQQIPNATLVPLEACGHFLFYDQREKFNEDLAQFLQEWS